MVDRRRATVSIALSNGANTLVVALQSILLMPLFLRIIGTRLYGAWAGTGDILLWMQAFDLGLPNLMGQRIAAAHGKEDEASVGRWLATGLMVLGIVSFVIISGALLVAARLPAFFESMSPLERTELARAFALAGVGSGLVMLNNGVLVYARAIQRPAILNAVMIASSLANLGITLFFLFRGAGLYAIAYGILARSCFQGIANTGFLLVELRRGLGVHFRFDRKVFLEAMWLMPATLMGGLAYAALNQSELLILNFTVGPVAAASYLTIRRGAELVRSLSDSVAFSSYSSFAHFVAGGDMARAKQVLTELTDLRASVAIVLLAPYLAMNSSFVGVWVKGLVAPNAAWTIAIAVQTLVTGGAFLANYLFRATGELIVGSSLLAAEAVVRVIVMYGLSTAFGPIGIPIGAIATGVPTWILTERALKKRLGISTSWVPRYSLLLARSGVLLTSAAFGLLVVHPSWGFVGLVGGLTLVGSLLFALVSEPSLVRYRRRIPILRRGVAG